ncbi:DUF4352 domain-containing protein [Brachybacterium sp. p3-SID957]|uniref:DUF4352 domain-containing protein n=1 Tax=Brachybacterium sp. p3-SID957 TaxID=2916049 RepID=UPI00223C18F8|nr:DUF4352 domain-containing protein [Brachybacterium sp. p3-SID957]MCT1774531.1 DUF4352 domain-containing protein [Brachybacterium sp. p3-SID957]
MGFLRGTAYTCLGCLGIAAALIVLMMLAGALSGPSSSSDESGSDRSAASDGGGGDAEPGDNGESEQTSGQYAGSTGEMEGMRLTVASTERTTELSDSLWSAETGDEFFVVDLDVTNTGSEPLSVAMSEFSIVGADGTVYAADEDVFMALEDPLIMEDVNPGITYTGTLVFEVPAGLEFSEIRWTDSWSSDEPRVVIPLN